MYMNKKNLEELCHIVHFISFVEGCNRSGKLLTEAESRRLEKSITDYAINEIKRQMEAQHDKTRRK